MIVLAAKDADTPAGNPVGAPIPVAPVVAIVILGDMAVFIQTVGLDEGAAVVLFDDTVIFALAGDVSLEGTLST